MKDWLISSTDNILPILITSLGTSISVILYTRISGKRSFYKMSGFDFAMVIAIGSVIATTIVSKSVTLMQGLIGLLSIYFLQLVTAQLRKMKWVEKLIDNEPILIMEDGKMLSENLKKALITESDLKGKLREANVIQHTEVKAVVFESTGDISVLHSKDDRSLSDWMMEGVKR